MAAAIVTAVVNAAGKTIYRQAGRFISKSKFLREIRRAGKGIATGGQFVSRAAHARGLSKSALAHQMMLEVGPPIGGGDWVSRVKKSTERFSDMLANDNSLG